MQHLVVRPGYRRLGGFSTCKCVNSPALQERRFVAYDRRAKEGSTTMNSENFQPAPRRDRKQAGEILPGQLTQGNTVVSGMARSMSGTSWCVRRDRCLLVFVGTGRPGQRRIRDIAFERHDHLYGRRLLAVIYCLFRGAEFRKRKRSSSTTGKSSTIQTFPFGSSSPIYAAGNLHDSTRLSFSEFRWHLCRDRHHLRLQRHVRHVVVFRSPSCKFAPLLLSVEFDAEELAMRLEEKRAGYGGGFRHGTRRCRGLPRKALRLA